MKKFEHAGDSDKAGTEIMLWQLLFCVLPFTLATCPFGYVYQDQTNRCYKFVTAKQAFYMAEEMCQDTNAHLVSIYSSIENAWLSQYAQQQGMKGSFYTGLNRLIKTQWSWTDGNSVNYTRWAPGEPDVNAQCAAENASDSTWITVSCSTAYPYVCVQPSIDPPTTTCPPATAPPSCPAAPVIPSHCPSEWTYYVKTDSCYRHFLNAAFDQAEDVCKSIGGHLVSIHSDEENTFVSTLTHMGVEYKSEKQLTWIGLMKSNTNNLWSWMDGSAIDYLYWASGKPENLTGIENCAQMYSDSLDKNPVKDTDFRRWNNVQCSSSMRAYVCKQPALH